MRLVTALICALLGAATPAAAEGGLFPPGESTWTHNGSYMTARRVGQSLAIYYAAPRRGMAQAGAAPGTLLFRGTIDAGGFIQGTAFVFKRGCVDASYTVSGLQVQGGRFELKGPGPRFGRGCSYGLDWDSPHSRLPFEWVDDGD